MWLDHGVVEPRDLVNSGRILASRENAAHVNSLLVREPRVQGMNSLIPLSGNELAIRE